MKGFSFKMSILVIHDAILFNLNKLLYLKLLVLLFDCLSFKKPSSVWICWVMRVHLLLRLIFRYPATVDDPNNFISVLLGKLPMAFGPSSMQDLLHGPPSVLCHHKLGYHDLHHWTLCSHLPHHVVCFQSKGWVQTTVKMYCFLTLNSVCILYDYPVRLLAKWQLSLFVFFTKNDLKHVFCSYLRNCMKSS